MSPLTADKLEIWVDKLPPSENRIRVHRWQGGQVYSAEAKAYKQFFIDLVRNEYTADLIRFVKAHDEYSMYALQMDFRFEYVINKGWPKTKTFYKKFDVGNRRKLLEDCLSEITGIDDSLFFSLTMTKRQSKEEGVLLTLTAAEPSDYGVQIK